MKKLLLIGLLSSGLVSAWWLLRSRPVLADTLATTTIQTTKLPKANSITTGVVEAGGQQPLLARTKGYVQYIFFAEGDYVHAGEVLIKLTNYNYVVAPHSGFLGPILVTSDQLLTTTTPVTTLSKHGYLLLPVAGQPLRRAGIQPGDSVSVYAATGPARLAIGQVGRPSSGPAADSSWEIKLASRAPFHLGERVSVSRFSSGKHSSVARAQPLPAHQ